VPLAVASLESPLMAPGSPARPMLTVDVAVLAGATPALLLVQRAFEPFAGDWALPGGFVEEREPVRDAAPRELTEETGLRAGALELVGVYDTPGRDPRGWTVSVAFLTTIASEATVRSADDARDARWFAADALPTLAFDHTAIVADALAAWAARR
jgi:8-oxo-dGTP diphosphatase